MYISRIIHFNFYILFHRHTFSFVIHYFILINSHLNIFFLFYYSIPTTRGWNQPMFLLRHSSWFWFQEYRDKNSIKCQRKFGCFVSQCQIVETPSHYFKDVSEVFTCWQKQCFILLSYPKL